MPFAIPMVWRERKDHITDCYFCMIYLKAINRKSKHRVQYLEVPSALRPIPHGPDFPVPEPNANMEYRYDSQRSDMIFIAGDDACKPDEDKQLVLWHKQNKTTWHETWTFQRSVVSFWAYVSKKNIYWHQKQFSPGIEKMKENVDSFSRSRIRHHWFIATKLLHWSNSWA